MGSSANGNTIKFEGVWTPKIAPTIIGMKEVWVRITLGIPDRCMVTLPCRMVKFYIILRQDQPWHYECEFQACQNMPDEIFPQDEEECENFAMELYPTTISRRYEI